MPELCACGRPLHYSNPDAERAVRRLCAELGETVVVTTPAGSWAVPRHYIALHGITARALPILGFPAANGTYRTE